MNSHEASYDTYRYKSFTEINMCMRGFCRFQTYEGGEKRERDIGLEYHELINYKFATDVRFRHKFATDLAMVFFPSEICDELFCNGFIFRCKFATNLFLLQICDGFCDDFFFHRKFATELTTVFISVANFVTEFSSVAKFATVFFRR